jgi:hypothetical protein
LNPLADAGCGDSVGRTGIIMNGETERDLGTPRKSFIAPALLDYALLAVCFNASTPAMADAVCRENQKHQERCADQSRVAVRGISAPGD